MKNFKKLSILTLLVAMAAIMFSCVDDDYDMPPVKQIPIGEIYTIQQIKDFYYNNNNSDYTFTEDASVYGTVTMDEETDNSYKTPFFQDNTGGIAIFVNNSGGLYIGDSIRVYLKDLKIMKYRDGLFQINDETGSNGVDIDANIIKQGHNSQRHPEEVTLAEILESTASKEYYQGRLVKINNVQFVDTDTSKTYYWEDEENGENKLIQDSLDNTIIVRTSSYSTFADYKIPNGSGSIIAIVSQYTDEMQLLIRRSSEVDMNGERFTVGGGGGTSEGTGTFDDPYNVAAAISNQGQNDVWVEGYIVGVYETIDNLGNNLTEFVPSFTSPYNTPYNMLIADSQTETDIANCMIIQLTSGEIRDVLNLVDNPSNQSKTVKVYGDLTSYFGDEGVKNTAGYWFEGDGINPEEPADVVVIGTSTTVSSLNETFDGATANADFSTNGWLNANKQGERYWQGKEYNSNKYVQATAFGATSATMESWLVTPGVTLTTPKKLSFDSATGYYKHAGLTVWVSTNFDGNKDNLFTSTWTQVSATIAAGPSNGYSDFVNSGDIDLSSYSGTIYVLFKYIGDNSTNTTTFQIDNVKIIDL